MLDGGTEGLLSRKRGKPLERAQLDRFFATYPHVRERWIALDAVVFAEFMRARLHVLERLAHAHMMRLSGGAPVSRVVVQSSHTVTFDAAFFDAPRAADQWDKLAHALLTPEFGRSGGRAGRRRCRLSEWVRRRHRRRPRPRPHRESRDPPLADG